jgi:hypothetical protein
MDRTSLVEHDLNEGRRLVQALDTVGFPLPAAFWFYHSERDRWQLMIGSPVVTDKGPLYAYEVIQKALASASPRIELNLDDIVVTSDLDPTVAKIRLALGTDGMPYVNQQRLSQAAIKEIYPHSVYVYRAERVIDVTRDTAVCLAVRDRVDGRRIWRRKDGRLIFQDGHLTDVRAQGYDVKKRLSRNGVSAVLHTITRVEKVGDKEYGDIQRMEFRDGQLATVEEVASHVEIAA